MKKRSEKQEDLDKLKVVLAKVSTVILSTFQGITVEDDTKLRRAVQAAGGNYQVVKNTLAERAGCGHSSRGTAQESERHEFDRVHQHRSGRAGKGVDQDREGCSGVSVSRGRCRRSRDFDQGDRAARESAVEGRIDQQDHVPAQRSGTAYRSGAQRAAA